MHELCKRSSFPGRNLPGLYNHGVPAAFLPSKLRFSPIASALHHLHHLVFLEPVSINSAHVDSETNHVYASLHISYVMLVIGKKKGVP